MENNTWIIVLIVGIVAVIVGYLVAVIENRLTTALKEGRDEASPDTPDEKPAPKLDEHDVLRVTINPALKWHLELDGTRIEPDGLTAEQRTRLINIVVQIRPWIEGKTLASAAPVVAPPELDLSTPALPSAPIGIQPLVPKPARVDMIRGFRTMLENDVKSPTPTKIPSIIGMIDDVLQKKLEGSPLAAKKIRLEEGSVGEVVVFVGATRYSGIDAVPDEVIKSVIREAIAEWDKK